MASKAASKMHLYWGSGSIPCWKVMIVLEEKGLQGYGQTMISFEKKEHKGEDIMKLNPRGQVPTFKDGDLVINESGAICDYLECKFAEQGNCLLPKDADARGKVLQRMHEAQNLNKAVIEGVVYYYFMTKPENMDKELLKTKKEAAAKELAIWEGYLKEGKGYVVGDAFTMADVFVYPVVAWVLRSKLDKTKYPSLVKYHDSLKTRPSIEASWPPHWKGTEGKDMFTGV